jgi:phenylalanyl-tRNA synthetase beta chain
MRVPLEWLSDFVDFELSTDELAERLTMTGLNVEGIERPSAQWHDVIVGKVVELEPHPRSRNPLNVAQVDVGRGRVTIVTGAPNIRAGDVVPVVLVGGRLPHGPDGAPVTIEAKPMAGITSEGMLGSARELGLSDDHTGIYILPPDAPIGAPLASVMGGDVLDIETVSNRPDTLSIMGIAREVAAITQQQVTMPDVTAISGIVDWVDEPSTEIQIDVPALCPRFSAMRIDGVTSATSPTWLASRLEAAGQRPINLLVDLTNYVMLEYGQPMHAFDAGRLETNRIVVRLARPGESVRTLDGVDRALPAEAVVVADGERAVSVAGIIGGEESEITEATTSLLLEAATWDAPNIRFTAKALGVRTEASSRFEKGQQPETTVPAILRFVQLLAQITDLPLRVSLLSDCVARELEDRVVTMPLRDLDRLVGVHIDAETAAEQLSLLGFGVTIHDTTISATVPFWRRVDIEQSADLVEEVARLVGFDSLPVTLPRRTMPPPATEPKRIWQAVIRDRLLAGGANEITTHSLTSYAAMSQLFLPENRSQVPEGLPWASIVPNPQGIEARRALVEPVKLQNPATTERQILRMTLLHSVLEVVSRNLKHSEERLAFFEIDRTFFRRSDDLPYERETLAIALSGTRHIRSWTEPQPGPYTFFDLKGLIEAMLHSVRVEDWEVSPINHPSMHPGRSAALRVEGREVAHLGQLHPEVAHAFELENFPVMVAEVDLDTLIDVAGGTRLFRDLPRYPAAYRDLAVVVPRELAAARLLQVVQREGGDVLESAKIFDVYEGEQLPSDQKSIAVEMAFRSVQGTLTQDDVSAVMQRIVGAIQQELGGTIRD